jgi:hypothetical protein
VFLLGKTGSVQSSTLPIHSDVSVYRFSDDVYDSE